MSRRSHPLHILLAEDSKDDRLLFREALKELDIYTELTTVPDGERLMKKLIEDPTALPDVLFLDINMPRKNGYECLIEIKANKRIKELPVIVTSTSYQKEMVDFLYEHGAQHYFQKPNTFSKYSKLIHDALLFVVEAGKMQPPSEEFILDAS